ncbi:hypothetical protein NEMBOFW57_007757 [Staphylotrichum longicolle]|uniref:Uncharacterized protein n=1 Tax=Staphylotrichum longicolle TaxID=669026 RepID=A0AAD4HXQ1_9PEZI|nr:hypothetical protein NEMBOFW57_007757 [Staphylotrichum longicolle]
MAQPPEAGPLRLQSSLDSAPVQPRVQPNLDALVEQKQHHGPQHQHQHQQHQHQQYQQKQPHPPHNPPQQYQQQQQQQQPQQQQQQHYHQQQQRQQQAFESAQLPGPPPHASGAPATTIPSGSGTQSLTLSSTKGECSAAIGDEKTRADGILTADASSHAHTSVAGAADPVPTARSAGSETQHNGGAPVPGIPDMSNTQPPPGPARQPVTYASPAAYPPAGMPPVSQYMYSVPSDPYRPNPTTLPSMRTLDHRQPQPQSQHGIPLSAHMAGPMTPAPAPAHMGYYGVHPHSHIYGLPDPNAMRFALAPGLVHDPRIALSGGRHKKVPPRRPLSPE